MQPTVKKRKFYGQSKITLWLTPKVYKASSYYTDSSGCVIATAIRQQLGVVPRVRVETVDIGDITYDIMGDSGGCRLISLLKEKRITVPVILVRQK